MKRKKEQRITGRTDSWVQRAKGKKSPDQDVINIALSEHDSHKASLAISALALLRALVGVLRSPKLNEHADLQRAVATELETKFHELAQQAGEESNPQWPYPSTQRKKPEKKRR